MLAAPFQALQASRGSANVKLQRSSSSCALRCPPRPSCHSLHCLRLLPSNHSAASSWDRLCRTASQLDTQMTGIEAASSHSHSFPSPISSCKSSTARRWRYRHSTSNTICCMNSHVGQALVSELIRLNENEIIVHSSAKHWSPKATNLTHTPTASLLSQNVSTA